MKQWQEASAVFDRQADAYDSWFEGSLVYEIELEAIRSLTADLPPPGLEIGVGPGRFACDLHIPMGVDPAVGALRLARQRGIACVAATGESLPVRTGSIGWIGIFFALCFVSRPEAVLRECYRVLLPGGALVIAMIPAHSAWGRALDAKKKDNHPFYRYADFSTVASIRSQLVHAGFTVTATSSTLYQSPDKLCSFEKPRPSLSEDAGCCVLRAQRNECS